MRIVEIQPSAYVDNMWIVNRDPEDPSYLPDTDTTEIMEGTRTPYPFFAGQDGRVLQEVFKGWRIIGFLNTNRTQGPIDLWWEEAFADPQRAVGMYVVTRDDKGQMSTHSTAIESAKVVDDLH